MAFQTLIRQAYFEMPPVTRAYTTACVLTTMSVQLDLLSPFQLYFNPILIWKNYQLWRLMTTFLFYGTFGFNFFFNLIFTYRYCRMLEENSFRGRTADFVTMFIFGSFFMIIAALFVNLLFLGKIFFLKNIYKNIQGRPSRWCICTTCFFSLEVSEVLVSRRLVV